MLTKQQEQDLKKRNNKIVMRYLNIAKKQPLATDFAIFAHLAPDYGLTVNMVAKIIRDYLKEHPTIYATK